MPVADITIDTNVLMHASNPNEERFDVSVQFLQNLIEVETSLCVDEGFDIIESKNRSLIGSEYLNKLVHGALGHSVVTHLALTGRLYPVSRTISLADKRKVNQMIRNRRDRTFICVAINSREHILVSHDYQDFSAGKRNKMQDLFDLIMVSAEEAMELIAA